MSLHELIATFVGWLTGQPQQPEPIRIPVEEEPRQRRRRDV